MHIAFLLHHAYDMGGTIRTTFNLASALAERHDVEIVSVFRRHEKPVFEAGPRVRLRYLVDEWKQSPGHHGRVGEHAVPARVFPRAERKYRDYSALTDRLIDEWLRTTDADVLVGTRPGLNTQLALRARPGPLVVGQAHVPLSTHTRGLRLTLRDVYPQLDALTTVTEADAEDYRRRMPMPGLRLAALPNPVPAPAVAPADGTRRWIAAAGRLAPVKGYDLLLRAFAEVAPHHPDWGLRIYGRGPMRKELQALIGTLGLEGRAHLMGMVHPLDDEWSRASVAVCSSRYEAFGMTIVEAMRCGLPVVSTRCPHGPAEIIDDGRDGRLVPMEDPRAMAAALLELTGDDTRRRHMGREALNSSARFDPARVAERYEDLFTELSAVRRSGTALRGALHRGRGAAFRRAYGTWDSLRTARRAREADAGTAGAR